MNLRTIKKYQRAPLVFGATLWFILGALSLSSCQTIEDAARAKIEEEIREAAPGQIPDEQPVDPSQIRLSTIIPGRSPSAGGVLIKITGFGFQENLQISFGDVLADQAQVFFQSATSIQVMAPPHTPGDVDIKILQNDESTTLEGAFEYYEEVSVIALIPGRAGTGGGDELLLEGRSLLDDSSVWFGDDVIATGHSTGDDNTGLVVIAPPLDFGVYDITVTNPNGSATLVAAYRPYEKVYVDRIEPFVGPLEGGIPVQVYGRGFVPGTRLRFGTQGAEALSDSSETTLNATLPAAVPFVEGVVTVEVDNENGLFKRPDAFVYIDTSDTSDRIIAVLPPASLIEGGGDIYIVGTGFEEGAEVLFGTTSATCEVEGANTISCIAPQNNEGDVQMVVTQGGHPLGDPFVFTYIDLRLDTIIPPEGARAGGTYVEISGNGLNVDTQIFIGDKEVSDLSIQSTSTATFKTPPGSVGSSTIRIEQAGIEVDATPLFTYFDPYKPYFWSWGGPIDNAVNITVQDAYDGSRIEDAWVIIGNDSETSLRGLTDSLGQVTLSREGLVGPLTITTAKNSFGSFSWVGSDARNLRMRLSPYPVPPPEPPPPPEGEGEGDPPEVQDPPPPATIRGTVFRIKDPYNYGDDLVMLTTSRDPSTWTLPEPGPNSVIVNNGPYELFAREGDLIVIALAGYLNEAGYFEPHAMGF
ncbi:IPT/TIG domain-containing protein, partial [Myxococcota bacterium]|nr:IPT/TIG domain-containing protein [Myxococcota bacterium]